MSTESTKNSDPLTTLDAEIKRAHRIVILLIVLALVTYVAWFWGVQRSPLGTDGDTWGVFGDFVGGLLNPVVAYAAFYWLTRSVRLQKEELHETRRALADSAAAQQSQAAHSFDSVRLNALTTLVSSIMSEVQVHRLHLEYLLGQIKPLSTGARALDGSWLEQLQLDGMLRDLNSHIERRMQERNAYEQEIRHILARYKTAA